MKKIIILLFLITSCGYQPLYKVNQEINNFKINEAKFIGNQNISEKIFIKLPFTLVETDKNLNKIIIETYKKTIEASKNSKGQVTSYRTTLNVKFKILNKNGETINEKYSQKEFSYSTDENKFKLKEYQSKVEENLINTIIQDIIIHLNYS